MSQPTFEGGVPIITCMYLVSWAVEHYSWQLGYHR